LNRKDNYFFLSYKKFVKKIVGLFLLQGLIPKQIDWNASLFSLQYGFLNESLITLQVTFT